jgi:hypothetical protein
MNLYRLRGELDRARMRHAYAIRERSRFEKTMDIDDEHAKRCWRKLDADVKRAEVNCGHAQHALSDAAFDDVFA